MEDKIIRGEYIDLALLLTANLHQSQAPEIKLFAVTKFKGLAWLSYNQQFRRCASSNLSLQWDKVDLELKMVTFSGLAKPHYGISSSPYHCEDVCPSADPYRKQHHSQTVCFQDL